MIRVVLVFAAFISFNSPAWAFPVTPDPEKTPGEICTKKDPHFKEYRYAEKIPYCRRKVSSGLRKRIYKYYGIDYKKKRQYTIDHFIPLSMGGSNSIENLWPEHRKVKATRPDLEFEVFKDLRDGFLTQEEAIAIIVDAKMNLMLEK